MKHSKKQQIIHLAEQQITHLAGVDEWMVKFKERSNIKQYLPNKSVKRIQKVM